VYIENIEQAIDTYFFTKQGKARARQLASERRIEVATYTDTVAEARELKPVIPHAWRFHDIRRRLTGLVLD